jgi:hypothetical protein
LSFAKTSSAGQLGDLAVWIRSLSQLDDHSPAPPVSAPPPLLVGGHRQLAIENLAVRHQLSVYKRTMTRPKLRTTGRLFWIGLPRVWAWWRQSLVIVTPDTVLRWQRRRFREYWTQLSGRATGGRPPINAEISALITRMATANPSQDTFWRRAEISLDFVARFGHDRPVPRLRAELQGLETA